MNPAGALTRQRVLSLGLFLLCAGAALFYWRRSAPPPDRDDPSPDAALTQACRSTGRWLARRLNSPRSALVHEPFVIAGDLNSQAIDAWRREQLLPTVAALERAFFSKRPDEPICVVLAEDAAGYRRYVDLLGAPGDAARSSHGLYRPHLRLIIVDVSHAGAFRHELTHALMDFDFPSAPAWLREGLAALYEEIATGKTLLGLPGPRLQTLQTALRNESSQPLEALFQTADLHDASESLHYATARCFCLYLQERGALEQTYRAVRENSAADPTGRAAVLHVLGVADVAQLAASFRDYALRLSEPPGK